MKQILLILLCLPLSLYTQIRVEEYLYPEYHLDSKVILEKNFDEPLLIQKK